jgi:hypothetical protein
MLCLFLPGLASEVRFHGSLRLFSSAYSLMQGSCLILVSRLSVCFGSPGKTINLSSDIALYALMTVGFLPR